MVKHGIETAASYGGAIAFKQHVPLDLFFRPLYKALDTNQSCLYKHCFLENTKGVAVKSRQKNTVQNNME